VKHEIVAVNSINNVCHVGGRGSKFLPLNTSTLLLVRVSQKSLARSHVD
jgi:hypothetical protein